MYYRYTSDYDKKNAFNIEAFLTNHLTLRESDIFQIEEIDFSEQ